jgi:hypothetical protein
MLIYTDKVKAFNFWYSHKRDRVFKNKSDRKSLHDEKIQELIISNTIEETIFNELI